MTSPIARLRGNSSAGQAAYAPTLGKLATSYAPPAIGSNNRGGRGSAFEPNPAVTNFQQRIKNQVQQGRNNTNAFVQTLEQQRQQRIAQQQQQSSSSPDFSGAGGSSTYKGPMPGFFDPKTTSGLRQNIVKSAYSRLGTPYAWGGGGYGQFAGRGKGMGTQNVVGVDCSGLVSWVYSQYGIKGPRQSDAMLRAMGYKTSVKNARPGDLIGWGKGGHVALYAGNGYIIESPKPGGHVRYRRVPPGTFAVHLSLPGD